MKKLFGSWHMTWLRTIVFAAATGIYTGVVMNIPAVLAVVLTVLLKMSGRVLI